MDPGAREIPVGQILTSSVKEAESGRQKGCPADERQRSCLLCTSSPNKADFISA